MSIASLVLSLLFAQGPKIAAPIRPSHPGMVLASSVPRMTRTVPLTKEQILAIAAKAMPSKVVHRLTLISATRLFEKDVFLASVQGDVLVDGGQDSILLDAKRDGSSGSSMMVSLYGQNNRGEYVVTFEGQDAGALQMRFESASASETIDVPQGEFHILVVLTVGQSGYFKITPLVTTGRGVWLGIDAIQIYRVD